MNKNNYNCVFVASPPRAGSSVTANLLSKAGLFGGKTKVADQWNKYGYFENLEITKYVIEYLRRNDKNKLGKRFQPKNLKEDFDVFGDLVESVLFEQGWDGKSTWFYKDPKIPLCWKLFNKHFPKAKWIICRRDRNDLLQSLEKTPFMDAYTSKKDWNTFLDHYEILINEIKTNCAYFEIDIQQVFKHDTKQIDAMMTFLGIDPDDSKNVSDCIDRKEWHYGAKN